MGGFFFVVKEEIGCIPTKCKGFVVHLFYQAYIPMECGNEFAHLVPFTFHPSGMSPSARFNSYFADFNEANARINPKAMLNSAANNT